MSQETWEGRWKLKWEMRGEGFFLAPVLESIFLLIQHHCLLSLAPCASVTVWKLCPNRWRERRNEGGAAGLILLNRSCSCSVRERFVYPNPSPWTSHLLLGMAMSLRADRTTETGSWKDGGRGGKRCKEGSRAGECGTETLQEIAERVMSDRREQWEKDRGDLGIRMSDTGIAGGVKWREMQTEKRKK